LKRKAVTHTAQNSPTAQKRIRTKTEQQGIEATEQWAKRDVGRAGVSGRGCGPGGFHEGGVAHGTSSHGAFLCLLHLQSDVRETFAPRV
jgi:hypothetical protein